MMRRLLPALALILATAAAHAQTFGPVPTGSSGGGISSLTTSAGVCGGPITTAGALTLCTTVQAMSGASYTVLTGDRETWLDFSNSGAIAVTVPGSGTAGFPTQWRATLNDVGTGTITATPGAGLICGAGTLTIYPKQSVLITSDGANWQCSWSPAKVATSGSASDLGSGTLAAARGGAGANSGVLEADGAGNVGAVTIGSGLSYIGTTLTATGGAGTPGGSPNSVQYNNAGSFGGLGPTANSVVVTDGSGVPSEATTLPSGLTIPGPTMTGTVSMAGATAVNVPTPTSSANAVTKAYADAIGSGSVWHASTVAATTASLTATYSNGTAGVGATLTNSTTQAAFSTDGVSPSVNQRVLVNKQSSTFQNGVYTLTTVGTGASNWVLTRATDFDQTTEIIPGALVPVSGGTLYANTSWLQTATVATIGTDPVLFQEFTNLITTPVTVPNGGTGATTLTAHGPLIGEGTSAVAAVTPGTSGQLLIGQGSSADPSFNSMSGDATINNAGAITVTKTSGSAFAASATTDTTDASNIGSGTLNAARLPTSSPITWTGTQTFGLIGGYTATLTVTASTGPTINSASCGTVIETTATTAVGISLPNLAAGCVIAFVQGGASAGQMTFTATALHSAHSYTKTFGQWAVVTLTAVDASGTWVLAGDGA